MAYQIQVKDKGGNSRLIEANESQKINIHSEDTIQISANKSGIFGFFQEKSTNIDNLIVIRNGKNLEIILENGDVLTFINFYHFNMSLSNSI